MSMGGSTYWMAPVKKNMRRFTERVSAKHCPNSSQDEGVTFFSDFRRRLGVPGEIIFDEKCVLVFTSWKYQGGRVDKSVPGTARGEDNRRGRRSTKDDTTRLLTPRGRRRHQFANKLVLQGGHKPLVTCCKDVHTRYKDPIAKY